MEKLRKKRVTVLSLGEKKVWNPNAKESWHIEFEKEPINDDRWNCFVSATVETKAQDDEGFQIFGESIASNSKSVIKVITMADIIKLLSGKGTQKEGKKNFIEKNGKNEKSDNKLSNIEVGKNGTSDNKLSNIVVGKNGTSDNKLSNIQFGENGKSYNKLSNIEVDIKENTSKIEATKSKKKKSLEFTMTRNFPILELAKEFAIFHDYECILPPDLMAGVLKCLILCLKEENIFWKKVQVVKERKFREAEIKANFIKSQMPFVVNSFDSEPSKKIFSTDHKERDESVGGPDLFIILYDFYNPYYFSNLLKINVPFIALFKIKNFKEILPRKLSSASMTAKMTKKMMVAEFWEILNNIPTADYNSEFKNFLFLEYHLPSLKNLEYSKQQIYQIISGEFLFNLYSMYHIYRQHKSFLQELYVQRLVKSLEPLDLLKCSVYNKLCDILITGMPSTIYIILYAMVEQIIAGIPETAFIYDEYEPEFCDFFSSASELDVVPGDIFKDSKGKAYILVTPCLQCRDKKFMPPGFCENPCLEDSEKLAEVPNEKMKAIENFYAEQSSTESILMKNLEKEKSISETLLDEILNQKKKEKKKNKLQKSPELCFYADKFFLHTYNSDPRITDPKEIMKKFLKETDVTQLWSKFPKLSSSEKAFYNHHFLRFDEISKMDTNVLKLKIAFFLSIKFLGVSLSYFYKGEEETKSEMFSTAFREKLKRLSRVRFEQRETFYYTRNNKIAFSFIIFKPISPEHHHRAIRKIAPKTSRADRFKSITDPESSILRKVTSHFNLYYVTHRVSGFNFPLYKSIENIYSSSFSNKIKHKDKKLAALYSLIDCFDISSLSEPFLLNSKEDYTNLMKNFNFFENLDSTQIVQRILKALEEFNTLQCSHYPPTDNLFVIMYNDYDYRGIFYRYAVISMLTPLALREFYNHLYSELNDWLITEEEEYEKFLNQTREKNKALNDVSDEKYLNKLIRKFNEMNDEQKNEFLNLDFVNLVRNKQLEMDVNKEELKDLPVKPKFEYPSKISFVATNFSDLRVEIHKKVQEYHSPDGTKISVTIDSWLYEYFSLLALSIKKSKLKFYYHTLLGKETQSSIFSLKTDSDIIFVFHKNELLPLSSLTQSKFSEDIDSKSSSVDTGSKSDVYLENIWEYSVTASWPTGLIIQTIYTTDNNFYVKQSYIDVYKRGKSIQNEKARCFLRNGQILVFKENGKVEILCASGTKYIIKEFAKPQKSSAQGSVDDDLLGNNLNFSVLHYISVTTVGEVWEENRKYCKDKRKLIETLKIYIGNDSETQETFYKRDDGLSCMLWPNGKLVTTFPDGTKITSTPSFDNTEIEVDWSLAEKLNFLEMEKNYKEDKSNNDYKQEDISRKSFQNFALQSIDETNIDKNENFISISLTYVMEHPKYSTVFFDAGNDFLEMKMPKGISMKIQSKTQYLIKQEQTNFIVGNNSIQFITKCNRCDHKSSAEINFKHSEILCEFNDFFGNFFRIFRNGETVYQDLRDEVSDDEKKESSEKCNHLKQVSEKQKCFVLERNFNGIEFLHNDHFARQCFKLPEDTYYDLDETSPKNSILTHTFSIPYFKVGCEKWEMDYEDKNNALPTNLKKKDLKELEAKETVKNRFKYPFPNGQTTNCKCTTTEVMKKKCPIPKFIVTRIVKCLVSDPKSIIDEFEKNVSIYQKYATKIYKEYKRRKLRQKLSHEEKEEPVAKRLNQIATNLNLNKNLCSLSFNEPHMSTRHLHHYDHSIELMEELKDGIMNGSKDFPLCKYIRGHLPRFTKLDSIFEEMEDEDAR